MSAVLRHRVVLAGLVVRLAAIVLATPLLHLQAFAPGAGLAPVSPGDGLPLQLVATLAGAIGGLAGAPSLGLALVILAADVAIALLLARSGATERRAEVARLYWLSPLVVWLSYANGTLAAVTAALLVCAFVLLERRHYAWSGLVLGIACAAEPTLLLLVLPVAVMFAGSLARLQSKARELLSAMAAATGALVLLPALVSPGFRSDVLGVALAPLFRLYVPLSGIAGIAVLPLLLAALLYTMWRVRLIDRHLLWTFVTLSLLVAVMCGAAGAGLTLLACVFLCRHAAYAERSGRAGLAALSALLLLSAALSLPGPVVSDLSPGLPLAGFLAPALANLIFLLMPTALAMVAGVVGVQVIVRGIARFHTYLVTRRPVAIGIAGDSGVGKDTLSAAVAALFSPLTVATVSGDDYHNWDRNKPMWRALTHLNPLANDLPLFNRHVTQLVDRRWVRARHYDHAVGRMTKPLLIRPGEVVVASGLHALASPTLNALYDLKVYLDMDEALRRHFKIRRDVGVRGHPLERVLSSIERREHDAAAFIHPQKEAADVVFRLVPRRPDLLGKAGGQVPLRLEVDAAPGIGFEPVARALVAVAGIFAMEVPRAGGRSQLIVEGEPAGIDIAAAARRFGSLPEELMRDAPEWEGGLLGVMQLVMLDLIEQVRYRRSVNA